MSKYVSLAAAAAVAAGLSIATSAGPTHAATVTMVHSVTGTGLDGNDCVGVFGQPFESCSVNDSPVVAKYGFDEGSWELNTTVWPDLDVNNFGVSSVGDDHTWSYSGGIPAIRYWVTQFGREDGPPGTKTFNLMWDVVESALSTVGGPCDPNNPFTPSCLDAALNLTTASWSGDTSHLTLYDTGVVPLPAGLVLFLTGLAGVGFLGRYKAKQGGVPTA